MHVEEATCLLNKILPSPIRDFYKTEFRPTESQQIFHSKCIQISLIAAALQQTVHTRGQIAEQFQIER